MAPLPLTTHEKLVWKVFPAHARSEDTIYLARSENRAYVIFTIRFLSRYMVIKFFPVASLGPQPNIKNNTLFILVF